MNIIFRICKKLLQYLQLNDLYNFFVCQAIKRQNISLPKKSDGAKLSYAGMLSGPNKIVFGGGIKLRHLAEVYPEHKERFNILYLVSSCIPRGAEERIKLCRKAGVKIIWNQDGIGYPGWAGEDYRKINSLMGNIMHQSDWVIYQSEFCKLSADKFLGGFNGPTSLIYNCVDTFFFTPSELIMPFNPIKLLVAGTHDRSYRVLKAMEALGVLRKIKIDAELNIAGRLTWPHARREIVNKINALGLDGKVFISGPYLQKEAPAVYHQAHILLHLKYKDPCPTVVLEAMACGIPVISSRSGGISELLGNNSGITLDIGETWEELLSPEPKAIAEAIIHVMENWVEWSQRARQQVVNNFNKEKWLQVHKNIFDKLIIS